MNAQIATTCYAAEIADLHNQIADLKQWAPSARRDALIAMREERIEELESCMELGDEMAEVKADAAAEQVEVSAALESAITTAQAVGCALVTGAPAILRELERLVPGCTTQRNGMQIATVATEGGEIRVVRRANSYRCAVSWRAAR